MKPKKIKITWLKLISELAPALGAVGNMKVADVENMLNVVKTRKEIDKQLEIYNETRLKVLTDKCIKDAGKPVIDGEEYTYETPGDKAESLEKFAELNKSKVEIKLYPISLSSIQESELCTPNIIVGLGDMLNDKTL